MNDRYLTTDEAAALLQLSPRALTALRIRGGGPAYRKLNARAVRYTESDIRRWADAKTRTSTSAEAMAA